MLLENVLEDYRSVVKLALNTYTMDIRSIVGWLLSQFATYFATVTATLLLTGTIGIGNNRNIVTDRPEESKYLQKKYNNDL